LDGNATQPVIAVVKVSDDLTAVPKGRIEIAIRPENTKSLRVVEKLQFRPEGIRPRYLHIDGDWRDHLVFALNSEEVPEGLLRRWDVGRN
jgi:ribosomal-protein-alanine N-acetyltransferase